MEREVLWAMAPACHLAAAFRLPFQKGGIRPAWLIRLGLFLYDHSVGVSSCPQRARSICAAIRRQAAEADLLQGLRVFRRLGR